ncbi:NAD(P)-dependent alcohol dehydrogenase [Geodermatophilus sp. SYSU D00742]
MQDERMGERAGPAAEVMTTVLQERYGAAPEQVLRLGQRARPEPGAGEVLVRVAAASVDRGTWHVMAGLPYPIRLAGFGLRRPEGPNPGRNLAGTVVAVGDGVEGFAPGDDVFGVGRGTFAEYALARPGKLAPMPAGTSSAAAAAVPVSGLTALQAVRDHGRVGAGQRVLVIGASGGVGTFAVQLAKDAGAEVTATCRTDKVAAVRALGADVVLDHAREDVTAGGQRYDVVLDIGGNRRLAELRRALTPRGRLVIVGGENGGRWLGGTDRQLRASVLSPFVAQRLGTFVASENAADLRVLAGLLEAGRLTPVLDRSYPLADTAAAVRRLLDGDGVGKVVVTVP